MNKTMSIGLSRGVLEHSETAVYKYSTKFHQICRIAAVLESCRLGAIWRANPLRRISGHVHFIL